MSHGIIDMGLAHTIQGIRGKDILTESHHVVLGTVTVAVRQLLP